jgi:hypothetical protein
MNARTIALSGLFVCLTIAGVRAATIWREGEQPTRNTMTRHPWWYDKVKTDELSGGAWISNYAETEGTAGYDLEAPEDGDYAFWIRANPVLARLSYRLDGGPWKLVSMGQAIDRRNIAEDDHADMRFISWIDAGRLHLTAGRHTIEFRMHSETQNHGGLDAFVLTTESFFPNGKAQPGEDSTQARSVSSADTWTFQPGRDEFTDDALMDLRAMNEKFAGEHGFIRLSEDGESFVRGDGEPIRFWATGSDIGGFEPADMATHARFLAKYGVNLARVHVKVYDDREGAKITDVDEKAIDRAFRAIAELKKQGIYTTWTPYWAWQKAPKSWGLEGYENEQLWGLLFLRDDMKEGYKAWMRAFYSRVNPYTGLAVKDDPAMAIIQIQNEDSLLFWTTQGLKPGMMDLFGRKYANWLKARYGSLEKAREAWGGQAHQDDDLAGGRMGIYNIYHMTIPQQGGMALRIADEVHFFTETMREFNEEMGRFYHEELGCKQLINACNWRPGSTLLLNDAERWSYAGNEVIAVNRYYSNLHVGENNGYRIDPGHHFQSISALRQPTAFPLNIKQVVGKPMIVTETHWNNPMLYQSEGPFLIAAYQSLAGVDAVCWSGASDPTWMLDPRRPWWNVRGMNPLHKWTTSIPPITGMYPANAMLFRKGYVRAGKVVVHEERSMEDIWQRRVPIIAEEAGYDPNRDQGAYSPRSSVKQDVDRLAFLVGPVEVRYDGDSANSRVTDVAPYIDRANKTVRSVTGELTWDYGTGLCVLASPRAQGVTGFLRAGGGEFRLPDVTIRSENEYATVSVVAMDDLPLKQSQHVLVQVGTTARTTGWATKDAEITLREGQGKVRVQEIVNTGAGPWQVVRTRMSLELTNPHLTRATLLDPNGYAIREVETRRQGDRITLKLPEEAMYVILR